MKISIQLLMMVIIIMALAGGANAEGTWELLQDIPSFEKISDCVVDNDDVLWVSSYYNGVYSYDGESWRKYTSIDGFGEEHSAGLTLAPDGAVWICAKGGLYRYNGIKWDGYPYPFIVYISHRSKIEVDQNGTVWCGLNHDLISMKDGSWTFYGKADGLPDDMIFTDNLVVSPDGRVCVSFSYPVPDPKSNLLEDGTYFFDGVSWNATYIPVSQGDGKNFNVDFYILVYSPDGEFWGIYQGNFYRLNGSEWELMFYKYFLGSYAFVFDSFGTMWATSWAETSGYGVSRFDGNKWIEYTGADGLPDKVIFLADGINGEMWAATEKEIARFTPDGTNVEKAEPLTFELTGNFPNPFNNSTTINFTLPNESLTELAIYNIAGQKIRTLVFAERLSRGQHRVSWDGCDEWENAVSSGIYFYRLSVDGHALSGRMMMMK